jgi:hypothetical protein
MPIRVILVVCLVGLTALCSYIGDDDVIYQFLNRKPTPREAIIRIRWVMLKALTSIYGGGLLAIAIVRFLMSCCSINLSENPATLTGFACMAVASLLISVMQNGIRHLRGRPTRPLIDRVVWRRSLGPRGGEL